MTKLRHTNTAKLMRGHSHGTHQKDLIVLHETVSGDIAGLGDILGVGKYLASKDYGIHGMTDADGNVAWADGMGSAIFWHAGGVNERAIGIEQVSRVMISAPTRTLRAHVWALRKAELRATARLISAITNSHPHIPLRYSDGLHPGITSHWDVSQHFTASEGHTDCFPLQKGGYYPILQVIAMAKLLKPLNYKFK